MKICMAQLNYRIGDLENNTSKILKAMQHGKEKHADLIIFSELSLTGYPPKDLLDYDSFIERCNEQIERLCQASKGISVIVGAPQINSNPNGKKLFNSALLIENGKIKFIQHKTLLPNYDIFNESRFFEVNKSHHCIKIGSKKVAITICEDLWNMGQKKLYEQTPMDELIKEKPDFIVNISASPYNYNQMEQRESIMTENARKYKLPLVYVNQVGGNTELLFDGGSVFINQNGEVVKRLNFFDETIETIEISNSKRDPEIKPNKNGDIKHIHKAILMGLKDYFKKLGFTQAVFGSSGGIDSAVTGALAVEVLGKENVSAVLMPSKFSSDSSIIDAQELSKNLGIKEFILPIQNVVDEFENTLQKNFSQQNRDVTEENLQARARGVLLMAMSNKFGYILLNTSNKSESAVGYTTLYGDMSGGLSVIGDVYKTQVYQMAKYINRHEEIIPQNIITKAPSAELRPNQKDTDSLPEYVKLDEILFNYIENQLGWQQIVDLGFDERLVRKVVKMVDQNVYKRFQAPPTLRISSKAFGLGRQMPIVGKYHF